MSDLRIHVPFCGLYETIHDHTLDQALESLKESGEPIDTDDVEWRAVHLAYVQSYLKEAAKVLGIDLAYSDVVSPKFFNFGNDVLFAKVDTQAFLALHDQIMADPVRSAGFRAHVAQALQSRPGFMPYYSDDLEDWGPVETWDDMQRGVVLAYRAAEVDLDEAMIAEDLAGAAEEMILAARLDPAPSP